MRIVKKSYKVASHSGTSLITTFQIKGLRLRKTVMVRPMKAAKSAKRES